MSEGGCLCGNVRIKAQPDPAGGKILCHCADCRKISGSVFSTNMLIEVPEVIKGKPKTFETKAASGRSIVSYFCDNCGSTMYRTGEAFGDKAVLKVGVLDGLDAVQSGKPQVELFAAERASWLPKIDGVGQKKAMPDSDSLLLYRAFLA